MAREGRKPTAREVAARVNGTPAGESAPQEPPGPTIVVFPVGFSASSGEHPQIDGTLLDCRFDLPGGGALIMRMPLPGALAVSAELAGAVKALAEATDSGIHLPHGVDLDAEAKAQDKLRGGDGGGA